MTIDKKYVSKSYYKKVDRQGFVWYLNPNSCVDKPLLNGNRWQPKIANLLISILKPGMCFVDIGANFGYFSLVASKLVGDSGKVLAFEPMPNFYKRLEWHIQENTLITGKISKKKHDCAMILELPSTTFAKKSVTVFNLRSCLREEPERSETYKWR